MRTLVLLAFTFIQLMSFGLNANASEDFSKLMEAYEKVLNSKSYWKSKTELNKIIQSDVESKILFFWKYIDWCEEKYSARKCYDDIDEVSQKFKISKNEIIEINKKKKKLINIVFEKSKIDLKKDKYFGPVSDFDWLNKTGFKVPANLYLDAISIALDKRKIVTVPVYLDTYKTRYSRSERNSEALTQIENRLKEMRINLPLQYAAAVATNQNGFKPYSIAVRIPPRIPKGVKKIEHCELSYDLRSNEAVNVKIEYCTNKKLKKEAKITLEKWKFNHPQLDGKFVEMIDLKQKIIFDINRQLIPKRISIKP